MVASWILFLKKIADAMNEGKKRRNDKETTALINNEAIAYVQESVVISYKVIGRLWQNLSQNLYCGVRFVSLN